MVHYLHALKYGRLSSIVVTSIHDTYCFRPTLLCGSDSRPEHSFTATTSITGELFSNILQIDMSTLQTKKGEKTLQGPPSHCPLDR